MTTTKKINHGSVKLTRENITQGRLGEKIRSIRTKIDEIDLKILNLISERKDLVTEIVKFKNRNQIIDQERISKILESLDAEASKRGIPRALVRKLWEGMIQSFISYEEELFDKSKN